MTEVLIALYLYYFPYLILDVLRDVFTWKAWLGLLLLVLGLRGFIIYAGLVVSTIDDD